MRLLGRPLSLLLETAMVGRVTEWTYILIVYHQYVALLFISLEAHCRQCSIFLSFAATQVGTLMLAT